MSITYSLLLGIDAASLSLFLSFSVYLSLSLSLGLFLFRLFLLVSLSLFSSFVHFFIFSCLYCGTQSCHTYISTCHHGALNCCHLHSSSSSRTSHGYLLHRRSNASSRTMRRIGSFWRTPLLSLCTSTFRQADTSKRSKWHYNPVSTMLLHVELCHVHTICRF